MLNYKKENECECCDDDEILNHMKFCYRIPKNWAIDEDSIAIHEDRVTATNVISYSESMETSNAQPLLSDYEETFYGYDDVKEVKLVNYSDSESDQSETSEKEEETDFKVVEKKPLKRKSLMFVSSSDEEKKKKKKKKL